MLLTIASDQQGLLQVAHITDSTKVIVKQLDAVPPVYTSEVILVRGDIKEVGEEALELFFTNNKKCGGGEIVDIKIENDNEVIITFQDPAGMYVYPSIHVFNKDNRTIAAPKACCIMASSAAKVEKVIL